MKRKVKSTKPRTEAHVLPHVAAGLRAFRQANARKALATLDARAALDDEQAYIVKVILRITLAGLDPRKTLGIAPKRGNPPANEQWHKALSDHYWLLREKEPKEAAVATEVAKFWGLDLSVVRRHAKTHRSGFAGRRRQFTEDQMIGIAELCVQHWNLRAKQGN